MFLNESRGDEAIRPERLIDCFVAPMQSIGAPRNDAQKAIFQEPSLFSVSRHPPLVIRVHVRLIVLVPGHKLDLPFHQLADILVVDERRFAGSGDNHPVRL